MILNKKALTLIEILIALTILSLIIIVFFDTFTIGTLITSSSEKNVQALYLAKKKLEEAKDKISNDLDPEGEYFFQDEELGIKYYYRIEVKELSYGIKEIKVTFFYDKKEVVLQTRLGIK